ncbi:MAG TPA: Rieske (2Fe-2S) protein [Candidatus Limnocylindrales bacterium]|nr:Rieske (2Fe-2S) protein [Candidatus Limnocylindrales bacterium]
MTSRTTSRRAILAAPAFFAGVAAATSACQVYGGEAAAPEPAAPEPAAGAAGAAAPAAAPALGKLADIPVGGGRVFAAQKVVVTQPQAGVVKAFSAVCTHQGCAVTEVAGGTIKCPCHGSAFRVADGSVAAGPATRPLPAAKVTLDGDTIRLN